MGRPKEESKCGTLSPNGLTLSNLFKGQIANIHIGVLSVLKKERKKDGNTRERGTKRARLKSDAETNPPTVTLFLAVSSPGSPLLLPLHCPAHTVLLRSPDSLMLLCEFSSPLFLDPALAEREERKRERRRGLGKDWQTRNDAQVGVGNI